MPLVHVGFGKRARAAGETNWDRRYASSRKPRCRARGRIAAESVPRAAQMPERRTVAHGNAEADIGRGRVAAATEALNSRELQQDPLQIPTAGFTNPAPSPRCCPS